MQPVHNVQSEPRCAMCVGRVAGAHTRRSVATAGVLLFKGGAGAGPRNERSEPRCGGEVWGRKVGGAKVWGVVGGRCGGVLGGVWGCVRVEGVRVKGVGVRGVGCVWGGDFVHTTSCILLLSLKKR